VPPHLEVKGKHIVGLRLTALKTRRQRSGTWFPLQRKGSWVHIVELRITRPARGH